MNTSIESSEKKVKELEALKAKEAALIAEIKAAEELAKNDVKKVEAVESAKKTLASSLIAHETLLVIIRNFYNELVACNSEVTLIESDRTLERTPSTYLYAPGEKYDEKDWKGKTLKVKTTDLKITYRGHNINIEQFYSRNGRGRSTYKMSLPYNISDSRRGYTRAKTVIEKIDSYISIEASKAARASDEAKAKAAAIEFLKESTPKGTKIVTAQDYSRYGGNRRHSYNYVYYDVVTVTFKNGNSIKYKIHFDKDNIFALTLVRFEDTRLADAKEDPIKMINHLK